MARTPELHEPAVVRDAVDDRRRELVVREDGAPPAGLDVGGEYDAPPPVALGHRLAGQPRTVHVEGHVAELVQDQQPRLGNVGEQPVERALPLGLAQPRHQLGRLPEPRGVARGRRGDSERGGHAGLPAPRPAAGREVLGVAHERQGAHVLAAPAVRERDVRLVEAVERLRHGEPRLPGQPRPPRPVAVGGLRPGHRRARRDLPGSRGGEEGGDGVARYE